MIENFGLGMLGGVVLVDPETGEPYKVTGGGGGGGDVASVNGETGVVVLDAMDVGARPSTWVPDWADVASKPGTFPPAAHSHAAADVSSGTLAAARLPAASLTAQGAVELATAAETIAGSDAARATTPAGVKAALDAAVVRTDTATQGLTATQQANARDNIGTAAVMTFESDAEALAASVAGTIPARCFVVVVNP